MELLSAADVVELWANATKRPDHRPALQTCADIADILNQHLRSPAADRRRARDRWATDLIHQLLRHVSEELAIFEVVAPTSRSSREQWPPPAAGVRSFEDYERLIAFRLALLEVLPVYQPGARLSPAQAVWFGSIEGGAERAAALVKAAAERPKRVQRAHLWEFTAVICWLVARDALTKLGHRAGTSENSVAVQFATLATRRLGFADVTANAVAKRLRRHHI